jgi:GMP synthase (glutamine-hydrolysing)
MQTVVLPNTGAFDALDMHLIALQHLPWEGPSRIADIACELGWSVEVRRLWLGEAVPTRINAGELLAVMGGSMGVGDLGDARWPFLADEVTLLRAALAERRPVIGVCLGAQLLAHAAGAQVHPLHTGMPPARHREVGWGAITFQASAEQEPVLAGLDRAEPVVHWHGDTFDLPVGATLLASTLACPQQFFRLGTNVFGLQFHIEITAEQVAQWVIDDAEFVAAAGGPQHGERLLADTARLMPRHRQQGDRLIRNLLLACAAG